jgi:hypothetical protein
MKMGITYQTKAKKKLIALRESSNLDKEKVSSLMNENAALNEEIKSLRESASVASNQMYCKQKQIDVLQLEKLKTELNSQERLKIFEKDKWTLFQGLLDREVQLAAEKEDAKIYQELCEEVWSEKEELICRISVLEGVTSGQSLTIAELQRKLVAEGHIHGDVDEKDELEVDSDCEGVSATRCDEDALFSQMEEGLVGVSIA